MKTSQQTELRLSIGGMTCINCQLTIQNRLVKLSGVYSADVDFAAGTARIMYDGTARTRENISAAIQNLGYQVVQGGTAYTKSAVYLAVIAALFLLLQKTGVLNVLAPDVSAFSAGTASAAGFAMLFVIGALTSVHCVAMCGGINLSQVVPGTASSTAVRRAGSFLPVFLYNGGRVVSYTLIGAVFGAAGQLLGSTSADGSSIMPSAVQAGLKLAAGICMVLTGISLLGIFPALRRFVPHLPASFAGRITGAKARNIRRARPFIVGLLNGFMPCGPMQTMWIVAFASGNPLSGGLAMLAFSLGTVPLMAGLGSVIAVLGRKYSGTVMKTGAVLVVVMGLSMMAQGFALGGFTASGRQGGTAVASEPAAVSVPAAERITDGVQLVKSTLNPYQYPAITVKKGVPVRWEIEASEGSLTGCNYKMIFRDFGFMYTLGYGTNVIEFTPEREGTFTYTCWMGMVRGTVRVES